MIEKYSESIEKELLIEFDQALKDGDINVMTVHEKLSILRRIIALDLRKNLDGIQWWAVLRSDLR